MGERVRRRRVGEVVGRHVDRLHRGDRAGLRRGDALLQLPHLGGERRLVADGARHAAEQRRDLGARLDEAEDVVDEEQHVLALVAEVLGHRQAGEADAQARARRLVHLAVDERDLVDHAGLVHLEQRSLPSRVRSPTPAKTETPPCCCATLWISSWISTVLPTPAPPKRPILPPLTYGAIRSIDLDARLEDLDRRREVAERGRIAVDRPALDVLAGRLACRRRARRSRSRSGRASRRRPAPRSAPPVSTTSTPRARPSVVSIATARTRSSPRCCCTSAISVRVVAVAARDLDRERVVDRGQLVREDGVDDDALDLDDLAGRALRVLRHVSPCLPWKEPSCAGSAARGAANAAALYRSPPAGRLVPAVRVRPRSGGSRCLRDSGGSASSRCSRCRRGG